MGAHPLFLSLLHSSFYPSSLPHTYFSDTSSQQHLVYLFPPLSYPRIQTHTLLSALQFSHTTLFSNPQTNSCSSTFSSLHQRFSFPRPHPLTPITSLTPLIPPPTPFP